MKSNALTGSDGGDRGGGSGGGGGGGKYSIKGSGDNSNADEFGNAVDVVILLMMVMVK